MASLETIKNTPFLSSDFAKLMGKTTALNAAGLVGLVGGLVVVGEVFSWNEKRKAKKAAEEQK